MLNELEKKLRQHSRPYITDIELAALLKVSNDSRYGLVKRALANKELIRMRRGLYVLGPILTSNVAHPYELAQMIYGPSYISLESALSYHGLIPETVHAITNVSTKRKKRFTTELGVFTYATLPLTNFFIDVTHVKHNEGQFFVANPWKAICDYIYVYKKDWKSLEPLRESLRIEVEELPVLSAEKCESLTVFYKSKRIERFLKHVKEELNHDC